MKIIKVGAMWCPGCLVIQKDWVKFTNEYKDIETESLDLDFDCEEVEPLNVGKTLPVFIFMKDGIEVDRIIGEKKYEDLVKKVEELQ